MRNLKCYILPLCSGLFLLSASLPHAASYASAADVSAMTNDTAGVYESEDGAHIELFQSGSSSRWVMQWKQDGVEDLTFHLSGEPEHLETVGLDTSAPYRGSKMTVSFEKDSLYLRGKSDESVIEYYDDGRGERVMTKGADEQIEMGESAEEIELRLLSKEYAKTWSHLRKTHVAVNDEEVQIVSGQAKEAYQQGEVESVRAEDIKTFSKQRNLTDDEKKNFENILNQRNEKLNKVGEL